FQQQPQWLSHRGPLWTQRVLVRPRVKVLRFRPTGSAGITPMGRVVPATGHAATSAPSALAVTLVSAPVTRCTWASGRASNKRGRKRLRSPAGGVFYKRLVTQFSVPK